MTMFTEVVLYCRWIKSRLGRLYGTVMDPLYSSQACVIWVCQLRGCSSIEIQQGRVKCRRHVPFLQSQHRKQFRRRADTKKIKLFSNTLPVKPETFQLSGLKPPTPHTHPHTHPLHLVRPRFIYLFIKLEYVEVSLLLRCQKFSLFIMFTHFLLYLCYCPPQYIAESNPQIQFYSHPPAHKSYKTSV